MKLNIWSRWLKESFNKESFDKGLFTKNLGFDTHHQQRSGPQRVKDFIDDLQKIVSYFLLIEGFSVGISDMISSGTNDKIQETIEAKKQSIALVMQDLHLDIFENLSGQTNKQSLRVK